MNYLLIDTNVIIRRLRGQIDQKTWTALLSGRAPVISPVTLHELRRGIRPGSSWQLSMDTPPAPLVSAPTEEDWLLAADVLRKYFWKTHKGSQLALLQNDALIATSAKRLSAELWSVDTDMKIICKALDVPLISEA